MGLFLLVFILIDNTQIMFISFSTNAVIALSLARFGRRTRYHFRPNRSCPKRTRTNPQQWSHLAQHIPIVSPSKHLHSSLLYAARMTCPFVHGDVVWPSPTNCWKIHPIWLGVEQNADLTFHLRTDCSGYAAWFYQYACRRPI